MPASATPWSASAPRRGRAGPVPAAPRPTRSGWSCATGSARRSFSATRRRAAEGVILALTRDGKAAERLEAGDSGAVVVNQTPFYGESGGQVGDTGTIETETGARFRVTDTLKKADGLFVHIGVLEEGSLTAGEAARLKVDSDRRTTIRANHSATHLLHEALRRVLGKHVAQKGSLVAPDRLRFDFSHPKPITDAELAEVEDIANAMILQNSAVETRIMDRDAAIEAGAMALFGEKYGDEVRVVSMGQDRGEGAGTRTYSTELCGGTHARRTGDIGLLAIVSEAAVAAGVRRIEALTGNAARRYLAGQDKRLRDLAARLKVRPDEAVDRLDAVIEERRRFERELADARKKLAMGGGGEGGSPVIRVGAISMLARAVEGVAPKDLRGLVDEGKRQLGSGVVAIVGVNDGKAGLVVGVTSDLAGRISAVELVKAGAEALGGSGGGGRPELAQAGGPDGSRAEAALKAIEGRIAELAA